jgi:hypothetical protein
VYCVAFFCEITAQKLELELSSITAKEADVKIKDLEETLKKSDDKVPIKSCI